MILLTRAILGALLLTATFPQSIDGPADTTSIRVRTDLVELFITVRQGNHPLRGLTPADFIITDNGKVQRLAYLKTEESVLRIVMLLDTSASMAEDLPFVEAAGLRFLSSLREGDQVGLFTFGGRIRELATVDSDLERVGGALRGIRASGNTHLFDAVARGVVELQTPGIRRGIVLFTDGNDTASRLSKESVARLCGRSAVPLFVVGSGEAVRDYKLKRDLEELAEATGGAAYFPKEMDDLNRSFDAVSVRLRSGYGAGYYPDSVPDGQWHRIHVKLREKKGHVTAREGYFAD